MERIIKCSIVKAKLEFVYWDLIWRWVIIFYNISKNVILTFKYSTKNKSIGKRVAIKVSHFEKQEWLIPSRSLVCELESIGDNFLKKKN